MALDLNSLPPLAATLPSPPSRLKWSVVFLASCLVGTVLMLLLWPKSLPTSTVLFWTTVIGIPVIASAALAVVPFLLRAAAERNVNTWNRARETLVAKAYQSESRCIAVLAGGYRFSLDDEVNSISSVADGDLLLAAQLTPDRARSIEARWFDAPTCPVDEHTVAYDTSRQLQSFDDVLTKLLACVSSAIRRLPAKVPLSVRLHVTTPLLVDLVRKRFDLAWKAATLGDANVVHEAVLPSLMSLDTWLDQPSDSARDHATLLIGIQLHRLVSKPPAKGCAEAGVALLTIPEDLAQRTGLHGKARIARPREGSIATLPETLKLALTWGAAQSDLIGHLWHTGFDRSGERILSAEIKSANAMAIEQQASTFHDLDRIVGHTGSVAEWFAIACACEYADTFGGPQLVAAHTGRHVVFSVVRPTDRQALHASL